MKYVYCLLAGLAASIVIDLTVWLEFGESLTHAEGILAFMVGYCFAMTLQEIKPT